MSQAHRLQVVKSGKAEALAPGRGFSPAYRAKSGETEQLALHVCGRCTSETGNQFTALIQVRTGSVVVASAKGTRLSGGMLSWACARCHTPYYLIKHFPST